MDLEPEIGRPRRTPMEIIDAIYNALPATGYDTVEKISKKSDVDWRTCQKWLQLMLYIQNKQRGDYLQTIIFSGNKGYGRKRRGRGEKAA